MHTKISKIWDNESWKLTHGRKTFPITYYQILKEIFG